MPLLADVLDGPWDIADAAGLAGRVLLALGGIFVAWEGASRTVVWNNQQAWTALGIGSLVFGLTGVVGWLRAGTVRLRDVKHEVLAEVQVARLATLGAPAQTATLVPWTTAQDSRPTGRAGRVVRGDGMSLYHRAECIFVQGKAVRSSAQADAELAGAAPCVVCQP